ncbi:hypothetical protein V22_30310 [Calycomorphotria hydatis]|uniref:Uncharacterized protein n=1 Tax=Calycomorphotria hydatis TaxID=2528027 RepID=A0A517TBM8_9PLAN|nr:hypothetical protein V22_30310 [Calycomorphotria hydatis]
MSGVIGFVTFGHSHVGTADHDHSVPTLGHHDHDHHSHGHSHSPDDGHHHNHPHADTEQDSSSTHVARSGWHVHFMPFCFRFTIWDTSSEIVLTDKTKNAKKTVTTQPRQTLVIPEAGIMTSELTLNTATSLKLLLLLCFSETHFEQQLCQPLLIATGSPEGIDRDPPLLPPPEKV